MAALNVLIVEDDAMIGMLLAETLEDMGYGVCAVTATEDEAVEVAGRCKPGLMIVDQHLREGTGVSAVQRILRTGPVPCVFISGVPDRLPWPGIRVLQKPFVENDLLQAIGVVVGTADAPGAVMPALAPVSSARGIRDLPR